MGHSCGLGMPHSRIIFQLVHPYKEIHALAMSTFSWEERKNIYFFLSDLTFLLLLVSTGFQLSPFNLFIPFRP